MTEQANKRSKSKPPLVSARTLALGVVFLGLIAVVGYIYFGPSSAGEIAPEPEVVIDAEGKPIPPPQPLVEPEPGTIPPGNLEEVRPS